MSDLNFILEAANGVLLRLMSGQSVTDREVRTIVGATSHQRIAAFLPLTLKKAFGAYFTPPNLARQLCGNRTLAENSVLFDPACGAGDLLLAAARALPRQRDVKMTLKLWGCALRGSDIRPEFVHLAKVRLALAAHRLFSNSTHSLPEKALGNFRFIRVADALNSKHPEATHVLMNPPFGQTTVAGCSWANGRVSAAAEFFMDSLSKARAGTVIAAVLPEALRTGPRYRAWRVEVGRLLAGLTTKSFGRFSSSVDIDVFVLKGRREGGAGGWPTKDRQTRTVGDFAHVSVGAVVPHRDPIMGAERPYICARSLGVARRTVPRLARRFSGTLHSTPFVAVRRTSSPRESPRLRGAVVQSASPVAVENHIIVLKPRGAVTCEELLEGLMSEKMSRWLNANARCRHVSVRLLRKAPWPQGKR